ncbi:MAG TPA: carboxymuconolactone decarboxylase family protein [Bdellovibrionota bacterium]|nr:carboxymuconolactone decarboxylase family protein [Bdellovibrionota bacterium]
MQPKPPKTYFDFIKRYPEIGEAWEILGRAGKEAGPLDAKTVRLLKLAISIGGRLEGAVHADTRRALAAGATREEIEQVIALAASTIGLPSTVAAFSWARETIRESRPKR